MKRSVYSLVLADEIIDEIDKIAYQLNTSRSNLINQILAEKVEVMTPEMRMKDIFSQIEELMGGKFQLLNQTSDAVMSVKSPLKFKYRPTIRYSFELFRSFQGCVGRLKVVFRTQNKELIENCGEFFSYWIKIEEKYIGKYFKSGLPAAISEGKFVRDFYEITNGGLTDDEISLWVGNYIQLFDKCIQIFFDNLENKGKALVKIEKLYRENLKYGTQVL